MKYKNTHHMAFLLTRYSNIKHSSFIRYTLSHPQSDNVPLFNLMPLVSRPKMLQRCEAAWSRVGGSTFITHLLFLSRISRFSAIAATQYQK